MQLTDALKAGGAGAIALLLGAVALGQLSAGPEASQGHVRVGTAPASSYALWATSLASPAVQRAVLGVDAGASIYVRSKACVVGVDGGADPGQYSVPGLVVVYDDDTTQPCVPGADPALEAWVQGRPDAPWACACAGDATCLGPDAGSALFGVTLGPGAWIGPGCTPKPCQELSGVSSWPASCPTR